MLNFFPIIGTNKLQTWQRLTFLMIEGTLHLHLQDISIAVSTMQLLHIKIVP